MNRKPGTIGLALTLFMAAGGFSCRYVMPERSIDYNAGRVSVELPRGLQYAEVDRNMDKATAVIVSLPNNSEIYVGKERTATPKDQLGDKIKPLLQNQREEDRMVYVAVSSQNDYGALVEVLDVIRNQDVARVGLLVTRTGVNFPSRLAVDLPALPDPNESLSVLRPNPLTLVVSISPDLKVRLNLDDKGTVNDLAPLTETLSQIFRQRQELGVYKPGFETRSDLPMSELVEKTVVVKAHRSLKYGDVIKIIDAIRGAGANPIVLQIDYLSP